MRRNKRKTVIFVIIIIFIVLSYSSLNVGNNFYMEKNLHISDDTYEGNNQIDDAIHINEGFYENLECYDNDYFRIQVKAGYKLNVDIYFNNSAGNLDLELYDAAPSRINESYSSNDIESVSYTTSSSSNFYIRVFYIDDPNSYNLSISIIAGNLFEVINVIKPDSSTIWNINSKYDIKWTASSLISTIRIELWDQYHREKIIADGIANNGSYPWIVPSDVGSGDDYQIVIKDASDLTPTDYSERFEIINPSISMDYLNIITPNASTVWENASTYEIKWEASSDFDYVDISLWLFPLFIDYIVEDTDNDGSYTWTVPNSLNTDEYYITIRNNETTYPFESTEEFWIINTKSVTEKIAISNPISRSKWIAGNQYEIGWHSSGGIGNVRITYRKNGGSETTINSSTENDGSYLWAISNSIASGDDYEITIYDASNPNIYDISDIFIIENDNDPLIKIYTPDDFTEWDTSIPHNIIWVSLGNILNVNIELFNRFGQVYNITLNLANVDFFTWNIPIQITGGIDFTIRISDSSNPSIYDISDEFDIINNEDPDNSITLVNPRTSSNFYIGNSYDINWEWFGDFGNVTIELYDDNQGYLLTIASQIPNSGTFNWNVPITLETRNDYYIGIYNSLNCTPFDTSAFFTITNDHSITVTKPNSSSVWEKTKTYEITWETTGTISYVKISLEFSATIITLNSSTENDGTYMWTVPDTLDEGDNYHIIINEKGADYIYDWSSTFSIIDFTPPSISIITPNSSSVWEMGDTYEISWNYTGDIENIDILLGYNSTLLPIVSSISNDGSYSWVIPDSLSHYNNYCIIIRDSNNPNVNDTSEDFSIISKMDGAPFPFELTITVVLISSITGIGIITTYIIIRKRKLKT
ncbi:MAG: Ser-Thr-rich GPI-anchored membrane family protein [Promethearchaeota archaeon]